MRSCGTKVFHLIVSTASTLIHPGFFSPHYGLGAGFTSTDLPDPQEFTTFDVIPAGLRCRIPAEDLLPPAGSEFSGSASQVKRLSTRIFSAIALSTLWLCQALAAQAPSAAQAAPTSPAEQPPVIHATTREVLLDLVVRDKHHHPVTDLRPEEVEVYEDGVRQQIRGFRDVQGAEELQNEQSAAQKGPTAPGKTAELAHPLNSLRQVNFVSVVFAQIAPLDLEFAREAVLEFLKSDTLPNTYVTIYRLNPNLKLVQVYTSDTKTLAKAVDAATKGLSIVGVDQSASIASSVVATVQADEANILSSPVSGQAAQLAIQQLAANPLPAIVNDPLWARNAAAQDASVTLGNALLTQADMEKGLRFSTSLADGMDAMDSLQALVHSQEKLPGRKIVLYLADGLAFPVNRRDVVDNLISYANRSGVTFYTVDTRGLNTADPLIQPLVALNRAGAESLAQGADPRSGHHEDDDIQLSAVSNKQLAMKELAESTGGFAVTDTNEIAIPMQRMMEDIRTHYELAYSPTSTNYDGHFRKIEVKVSRPKLTVQTRKGYYALPELNGQPLQPFELVALNAINTPASQGNLPYLVDLINFRPKPDAVDYEMAFEVPVSGLKATADPRTRKVRVQASLVALIHDAKGDVIAKVSRELAREVSNTDVELLGKDKILYAEPVELPGGHYVIDTAVTDVQAGKTAVRHISVFVDPGRSLGLSSLEVVKQFQPLAGPRNLSDPFELGNGRITPTLADSVASGTPVALYFIVYPAQLPASQNPKVTMELFRDGKKVAQHALELPKPEADGSIPVLVQVSPDPGQCDIHIVAQQGQLVAEANRSLKIE
jgi:VWFA-related protein